MSTDHLSNDSLTIIDLNDDCLIKIFQLLPLTGRLDLPFICKRFYYIAKNYDLNNVQNCLGVISEANCDHTQHCIDDEDTIFNLILEKRANDETFCMTSTNNFHPNTSLNKFDLPRVLFEQLLIKCSKLKVLSLRMIEIVDNRILNVIIKYCKRLEHLTISTTIIQVTNLVWLDFCNVCSNLRCLNVEYVDGLTDHFISNILRKSLKLECFAISGNNQQLHGYFFENLGPKIRSVSVKKIDFFTNRGSTALVSLMTGNGRQIKKLTFRGNLAGDFLNQINLIQKNFKKLEELELGDSLDDSSAAFQRILGQIIAKIDLKSISFNLPQLTQFSVALNSLFTKLIKLNYQTRLRSFKLSGAEISDKSIELLCDNFKQLNQFHLSHSSYFARENFLLTKQIFKHLSKLSGLKVLSINGLNLDDNFLALILKQCRQLERIDLRNCRLITNQSLIHLELYAQDVEQANIKVFLCGTDVSILKMDTSYLFTLPSNLKINFDPLRENLVDFDIIEDDFEFV